MIDDKKTTNNLTADVEEDGNVDYCLICNETGGIICCDKCPRGFHDTCLGIPDRKVLPEYWECPQCAIDEKVEEGDVMTVDDESYQKIAKAFKKSKDSDDFSEKVAELSKIYQ